MAEMAEAMTRVTPSTRLSPPPFQAYVAKAPIGAPGFYFFNVSLSLCNY